MENIERVLRGIKYSMENLSIGATSTNHEYYCGSIWNGSHHCLLRKSNTDKINRLEIDLYVDKGFINHFLSQINTKEDVYYKYKSTHNNYQFKAFYMYSETESEIKAKFEIFLKSLFEVMNKGKFSQAFIKENLLALTYLFSNYSTEEISILMEQEKTRIEIENF